MFELSWWGVSLLVLLSLRCLQRLYFVWKGGSHRWKFDPRLLFQEMLELKAVKVTEHVIKNKTYPVGN
jgi:hypothetical protein